MSGIASASITNYLSSISKAMRAFSLGLLALPCYAQAVSSADVSGPVSTSREGSVRDDAIRPFTFHASNEALADLRRRIAATKWPSPELVNDASQAFNSPPRVSWRATGRAITTGARSRSGSMRCPSSSRQSTAWIYISSTFVRKLPMRYPSLSRTAGQAQSLSR